MGELRRAFPAPVGAWSVVAVGGEGEARMHRARVRVEHGSQWSIHAALARAGVQQTIDPMRAELDSEWIGKTEWMYEAAAIVPHVREGSKCALRIELLDGTCDVFLGDLHLGKHQSAFVPFDVAIPRELRGRTLPLILRFAAPVTEVLRWQALLGARPVNGDWTPYCFSRSAACKFGWDWGPRVAGVGFRGAHFVCWDAARLAPLALSQAWDDDGSCTIKLGVEGEFEDCRLECSLTSPSGEVFPLDEAVRARTIRPEKRWQPWQHGGRANTAWYADVVAWDGVRVADAAGARIAPRRVQLDTSFDEVGRRFRFIVNDTPIFAKGANLVPMLLDGSQIRDWRAEMRRYRATGFNMIRVWGGGHYMPRAFYRACDDLGILVWQDFMFACATYPEEEPFASLISQEAAYQVRRLSQHASIALWCGGNEDILAWWSWGWKERLAPNQSWGRKYWCEVLGGVVHAHDGGTPYWEESPYSGSMEVHPNDPNAGDRHTWDSEAKLEGLRRVVPRFCSEFGHQSPPNFVTLSEELPASALVIGGDALRLRQKATGGDDVHLTPFMRSRFREPRALREFVAQAQHLQARAMEIGVRWHRANAPRSTGALIWQWNDVWAGHSWSLIDIAQRAKPAWHAVRRACARSLLSIEPTFAWTNEGLGELEVVLIDDRLFEDSEYFANRDLVAQVRRMSFAGAVLATASVRLCAHAEAGLGAATMRGRIPSSILDGACPRTELLVAHLEGAPRLSRATWFLGDDAELELQPAKLELVHGATARRAGAEVLRATTVIRELWIEPSETTGVNPRDGSWRTLLPGDFVELVPEEHAFTANCFAKASTRSK